MAIMAVRELHGRNEVQCEPAPFQASKLPCLVSC